jgi:predicted transcriptional regulator
MTKTHRKTAPASATPAKTTIAKTTPAKTTIAKTTSTRRTAKQREHLKAEISELDLQGYTQAQIAEQVGITQQSVSNYLKEIDDDIVQRIVGNRVAARQKQIDTVRQLKRNSWETIKAQQAELKRHPENRPRTNAAIAGERRFLLQCVEVENKLRGLYEKFAPTSQTPGDDLSQFSQDELDQYNAFAQSQPGTVLSDGHLGEDEDE